jgi:hypothetical protein
MPPTTPPETLFFTKSDVIQQQLARFIEIFLAVMQFSDIIGGNGYVILVINQPVQRQRFVQIFFCNPGVCRKITGSNVVENIAHSQRIPPGRVIGIGFIEYLNRFFVIFHPVTENPQIEPDTRYWILNP